MSIIFDLASYTSILIIILSIFQTIVGIGILVLGTPVLLLFGFEMIEVMTILLPLSIINSVTNVIYLKKKFKRVDIDFKMRNYFFLICLPGIFIGLIVLKIFNNVLNFNLLVAFVIWSFLAISFINKKKKIQISDAFKKFLIFLTGIIHGVTNSGGSLLSILIVSTHSKNVNFIRYQIIFFYFFLALFHYLSILLIFNFNFLDDLNLNYIVSLLVGIIIGNILSNRINAAQLRNCIFVLAFVSSIFLITHA